MPVLEDPGAYGYYREEGGGLMVGLFERCAPWKVAGILRIFPSASCRLIGSGMTPFSSAHVTGADHCGSRHEETFCGPESFMRIAPIVGEGRRSSRVISWRRA